MRQVVAKYLCDATSDWMETDDSTKVQKTSIWTHLMDPSYVVLYNNSSTPTHQILRRHPVPARRWVRRSLEQIEKSLDHQTPVQGKSPVKVFSVLKMPSPKKIKK